MHPPEHRGAPAFGRRAAARGPGTRDRLPHGAHDQRARMSGEEPGDIGIGEQGIDGREAAAQVGHGGFGAFFLVVSAGGFGTGTTSTPCASALTPLRLVLRTRTRYFAPAVSGVGTCTTTRS